MAQLSVDELFSRATTEKYNKFKNNAINILESIGSQEVFDRAQKLCTSPEHSKRELGVEVLSHLYDPENRFRSQSIKTLFDLLVREKNSDVLCSIGWGLHNLNVRRGLMDFARLRKHHSSKVRLGVVGAMLEIEYDYAVNTLIDLSRDQDKEVRNWSTFGLGAALDLDRQDIREALAARLKDRSRQVRLEAIYGLAKRKDYRAIDPLIEEIKAGPTNFDLTAAEQLATPRLLPTLCKANVDKDNFERLNRAIDACKSKND